MSEKNTKGAKPGFFSRPTKDQCKDAGMALILIGLLVLYFGGHSWLTPVLIVVTLLLMIQPKVIKPFAALWYGLSEVLGTIMSKVILSLVFFLVLTPMALLRQIMGKDTLQLKRWKKDKDSVYRESNAVVGPDDLEHMF